MEYMSYRRDFTGGSTFIICFVCMWTYVLGVDITIYTDDSGPVNSHITQNIGQYYTQLYSYGVIPTEERSLKFYIKACKQASILLSGTRDLVSNDYYELVIGGYTNSRIIMRRKYGSNGYLAQVGINAPLSCDEFRSFVVNWSTDGNIQIGTDSFLYVNVTDPTPLPVNGLGIMTAYGATGLWIFDLADCTNLTYGYLCDKNCGHCKSRDLCDRINGSCLAGCDNGWTGDKCDIDCPCPCKDEYNSQNFTREEWLEILAPQLDMIKQELKLNKYNLSSNIRRRTSASDNRMLSKGIGITGIICLILVIGLIILSDVSFIRESIQGHTRHHCI